MTLDPLEVVKTARANGEPQLAEWLQREVDAIDREKRNGRLLAVSLTLAAWGIIGAFIWWMVS